MKTALMRLIEAADQRANELKRDLPHADDRGAVLIERQIEHWEKLAKDGRAALSIDALDQHELNHDRL